MSSLTYYAEIFKLKADGNSLLTNDDIGTSKSGTGNINGDIKKICRKI